MRIDVGEETLLSVAYGLAHRGWQVPNRLDTRFQIASGAKGFTALAVASLVDDGQLALDTTARPVLDEDLPLIGDDVTVGSCTRGVAGRARASAGTCRATTGSVRVV